LILKTLVFIYRL